MVFAEIREENVAELERCIELNLPTMQGFAFEDLLQIQLIEGNNPVLSIADCSCLYLAEKFSGSRNLEVCFASKSCPVKCISDEIRIESKSILLNSLTITNNSGCGSALSYLNHLSEFVVSFPKFFVISIKLNEMTLNCEQVFWEYNASDMMVFKKGGVVSYDTLLP